MVNKFIFEYENNLINFSFNKCVANIYSLFNFLEKSATYTGDSELSKKIILCLRPIIPNLASQIYLKLYESDISSEKWPNYDKELIVDEQINLPIQIKGKLATTIKTKRDYKEEELLKEVYQIEKIKNKIEGKKILKVINVQNKIINIIIS